MLRFSLCCFSIVFAGTVLGQAQGPQPPLLGYLASDSPLSVRPIVGAPGAVVVGDPIPLPDDVTRFVPTPGQQFGLVERAGAAELGVLQLGVTNSGVVQPIPNTFSHADRVAFSPSGTVALLYSATLQQAQVVTGLPSSAQIAQSLDLTTLGGIPVTSLAVSDDGQTVLAGVSDGTSGAVWLSSNGQSAQQLASLGVPSALRFFSGSQDAVVSDSGWQQVSLLTGIAQQFNLQLLASAAQGITAPADVEISMDQQHVWVADSSGLFDLDLRSGAASAIDCPFAPAELHRLWGESVYGVASADNKNWGLWAPGAPATRLWKLAHSPEAR
jgi:hypothetical protein